MKSIRNEKHATINDTTATITTAASRTYIMKIFFSNAFDNRTTVEQRAFNANSYTRTNDRVQTHHQQNPIIMRLPSFKFVYVKYIYYPNIYWRRAAFSHLMRVFHIAWNRRACAHTHLSSSTCLSLSRHFYLLLGGSDFLPSSHAHIFGLHSQWTDPPKMRVSFIYWSQHPKNVCCCVVYNEWPFTERTTERRLPRVRNAYLKHQKVETSNAVVTRHTHTAAARAR